MAKIKIGISLVGLLKRKNLRITIRSEIELSLFSKDRENMISLLMISLARRLIFMNLYHMET